MDATLLDHLDWSWRGLDLDSTIPYRYLERQLWCEASLFTNRLGNHKTARCINGN
jgi:hypothetical protein